MCASLNSIEESNRIDFGSHLQSGFHQARSLIDYDTDGAGPGLAAVIRRTRGASRKESRGESEDGVAPLQL